MEQFIARESVDMKRRESELFEGVSEGLKSFTSTVDTRKGMSFSNFPHHL